MRLVLALLMCWGVAFAQDTTKYFKSVDYGWNWQRGKFRSGLILPTDTVNNKLGIAQIDATCYAWSGTKWKTISTTDTAFLVRYYRKNQVDSAILANTPVPFDSTSLSNRINLRVKYTDTASMLTPYLRKVDTASLSSRINLKLNATDTASLSSRINLKFTLPSLTSGSVLFSNGTTIAQDNSNFFWDNTNKRLGIGTTSPAAGVNVSGSVVGAVRFQCNNTNSGGFSDFSLFNNTAALSCQMIGTTEASTGAAGYGRIRSGNASNGLLLAAGGTNLLKFQTNDADRITVSGTGAVTVASLATGIVYSNAGVLTSTNPSDSTLKNSIEDIPYGLNDILKLKPKTYYYNSDSAKTYLKYGFIAQDVEKIMPKIVRKLDPENPESKLGLESEAIYVAMVKAIQQLEARVKELEKLLNK